MSQPGAWGGIVPAGDDWVGRRFADLERRIMELSTALTVQTLKTSPVQIAQLNNIVNSFKVNKVNTRIGSAVLTIPDNIDGKPFSTAIITADLAAYGVAPTDMGGYTADIFYVEVHVREWPGVYMFTPVAAPSGQTATATTGLGYQVTSEEVDLTPGASITIDTYAHSTVIDWPGTETSSYTRATGIFIR